MVFNPDPTKQAREAIFSGTLHSLKHTDLCCSSKSGNPKLFRAQTRQKTEF